MKLVKFVDVSKVSIFEAKESYEVSKNHNLPTECHVISFFSLRAAFEKVVVSFYRRKFLGMQFIL